MLALPIYDREEVSSILFFAFQSSEEHHAAVEVWSGACGDFELHHENGVIRTWIALSASVNMCTFLGPAVCQGALGNTPLPQILTNIGKSLAFLRSSGATEAGLDTGLSIPCMIDSKHLRGVSYS